MMRTVIAIHPPFAWLVDWTTLACAGTRWFLVTSQESRERLAVLGQLDVFEGTAVADAFDPDTLSAIVSPWANSAEGPHALRFATVIEPVQMAVAELRQRFGAPGANAADLRPFTDKLAMKRAMQGVDDLLPRYLPHDRTAFRRDPSGYAARVCAHLGLPIFAKPVAEHSSTGTARLDTPEALRRFLEESPHDLELDEYVPGEAFHLDALVVGGEVRWFGAGIYACPQAETLAGGPLAGISVDPNTPLFETLRTLNSRLLGSFVRVPDGATHMEVLRRPDGRWVFLEVAARAPGVRCPEMHAIVHGIDVRAAHYQVLTGLPVRRRRPSARHGGYYCPMKTERGRMTRLIDPPFESPHTAEWATGWRHRTDVARTMSQADCLGYFVFWNDDRAAIERDLARLRGFRSFELQRPAR